MEVKIEKEDHGKTLKSFLFGNLKLSRAQVSALKSDPEGIMVDGSHVTVRHILSEGERLSLRTDDTREGVNEDIVPVKMDLSFLYEDDNIIVVDKSGNMPVHPSHNHRDDTLANAMAYHFMQKGIPFNFRAVNRLDRDTSGLVIVAKNRMSANRFAKVIEGRSIQKGYIAILNGTLSCKSGRITTHIKREKESIITRCNCDESEGDIAITDYEVIAEGGSLTLVRAYPITGRTHQLRVHFSGLGCAILGDSLYGEASELISRHALHAESLEFIHPFKNEKMKIISEIPEDMKRIIREKILVEN